MNPGPSRAAHPVPVGHAAPTHDSQRHIRACRNEGVVVARIYALACMSIMAAAIVNLAFCPPHRGARRTPSRRLYAPVADRWAERSDRPVLHFPVGGSGDGGLFQLRLADPVAGA